MKHVLKIPQKMIPYSTQSISAADIAAVVKVLKSDWLTQGPAIDQFEAAIAKKVGAQYVVAVNSGTAALHAAYFAAGVGVGDEMIVPAITFAATGNAALYLGARPVFADVDLATGLIDLADAEKKITPKTKAIVGVDYAGRAAPLRELRALAKKYNLIFIEDGAQSLGASYGNRSVGTQADLTTFSFHPVKSITTGEGGVVVTNNLHFYEKMKLFRTHGITKDAHKLTRTDLAAWYHEMQVLGFNYRITDIQAVLGESQLKRLDTFISKRRAAAKRYEPLLKNIPGISLPPADTKDNQSAWHLYAIRLAPEIAHRRDEIFGKLRTAGIGVQVHYVPVYLHPYYRGLGYSEGLCAKAEVFAASEISLPLFPRITVAEQKYVADTLRNVLL
jgi:UDP-4-amino-4,6-dideoxy-N-acetyl-beta-L-altrosamine transaminase